MKFAVSNIAWSPLERIDAYNILKRYGVTGLEIAPGLFFHAAKNAFEPSDEIAKAALNEISSMGMQLVSMQSLLFGIEGAAIFEGKEALERFNEGMLQAINLASRFAIPNLVFGSPKQRVIPEEIEYAKAEAFAVNVFRDLGKHAAEAGTVIAMEFNPSAYGTNFLNDIQQTIRFVEKVDHPAIKLNFDVGAMYMNNQFGEIESFIKRANQLISHVHISEPNLDPAPADVEQTVRILKALNTIGYDRWVSIEMKPAPSEELAVLESSVSKLVQAVRVSKVVRR